MRTDQVPELPDREVTLFTTTCIYLIKDLAIPFRNLSDKTMIELFTQCAEYKL